MQRTKNAARNIIFGILLKIYQILIPFVMRTVITYILGVQYLGLTSLFTSVLQVLNLAELGVGSAMVFSMYRPIEENDTEKICALMKLYKKYYRMIGVAVFVLGMILLPFVPELITGEIPQNINLYILYLLNLGTTVVSYWLFAYKNSLFIAHQRTDIISKITLGTNTLQYILQFLVLILFKNYYYYLIVMLISQVINNISTAIAANKRYPQYQPSGNLLEEDCKTINSRIKDLFTAKVGGIITNSADSIVISAFLGLEVLAVYQNYYYILSAVIGFAGILFSSSIAGIGNSIVAESREKNYQDLKKFTFLLSGIMNVSISCLLCIYQPFMKLWMGERFMLDFKCVLLFCIYFYVYELTMIWATYKDAAGIWHQDRWRPLIGSAANLSVNLILVQHIGIYGILLSTIFSYLIINMPWMLLNMFRYIFKRSMLEYLKRIIYYAFITVLSAAVSYQITNMIPDDGMIFICIKLIICFVIPIFIFLLFCCKMKEFKAVIWLMKNLKGIKS